MEIVCITLQSSFIGLWLQCFTYKSAELSAKEKGKLQQSILDVLFKNGANFFITSQYCLPSETLTGTRAGMLVTTCLVADEFTPWGN
jgi:hypothetical protein